MHEEPPFKRGDRVIVHPSNGRNIRGEVTSCKPTKSSGWFVGVKDPHDDDGAVYTEYIWHQSYVTLDLTVVR